MELSKRQAKIVDIVKKSQPITGDEIADALKLSRATIRPDLAVLTMIDILGARPKYGYFYKGMVELKSFKDRVRNTIVEDHMSVPYAVEIGTSIYDSIVEMFINNIGTLFIVENSYIRGVVSRKDLIRASLGNLELTKTPIDIIMTRMPNIMTIDPKMNVYEAAKELFVHEFDGMPVVDENGKVLGRWTKTNILDLFVEFGQMEEK